MGNLVARDVDRRKKCALGYLFSLRDVDRMASLRNIFIFQIYVDSRDSGKYILYPRM
jgi:hypothetical protein